MVILETAQNANRTDYRLELDEDRLILSADVDDKVLPALRELKDAYNKHHASLQNDERTMRDEIDFREEELMHEGNG